MTEEQKKIAKQLGLRATTSDSYRTIGAKILDHVAAAIGEREVAEPTDRQIEYAESLGINLEKDSRRIISARIEDELEKRNLKALKNLKLKLGDKVILRNEIIPKEFVISSIKESGKIYFKGIGCPQAWASQVEIKIENGS